MGQKNRIYDAQSKTPLLVKYDCNSISSSKMKTEMHLPLQPHHLEMSDYVNSLGHLGSNGFQLI